MTASPWVPTDTSPTGGQLVDHHEPSQTRTDLTELRDDFASLRDRTRVLHDSTAYNHDRVRKFSLDDRAATHAREPLPDVLTQIYDLGFSWRDLSRMLDVSVPALRKWRQGEPATPANRMKVARLLATCEYLTQNVPTLHDVASWFEIPLVPDPAITPLDLYTDGREDLLLDYAEQQETDPTAILDRYDPEWRARRSDFEVIAGEDGIPSIQRRT